MRKLKYNKNILFFLFVTLNWVSRSYAQTFEGVLTYKVNIEVLPSLEKMGVTKNELIEKMKGEGLYADSEKIFYNKKGDYLILLESNQNVRIIYRNDSNKIYTFQDNSGFCNVKDASIDLETNLTKIKPSVTLLDTMATVNNMLCKVIRIKWKTGYYDYFFNDNYLSVNAELYKNYIYDGWAAYLQISKCLPVQLIKVTDDMMKVSYTLSGMKQENVDSSLFVIPTDHKYRFITN